MLRDFDGLLPLVVGVVGYVLNEGVNEGVLKSNKISFYDILTSKSYEHVYCIDVLTGPLFPKIFFVC